jgi:hypothetical protein
LWPDWVEQLKRDFFIRALKVVFDTHQLLTGGADKIEEIDVKPPIEVEKPAPGGSPGKAGDGKKQGEPKGGNEPKKPTEMTGPPKQPFMERHFGPRSNWFRLPEPSLPEPSASALPVWWLSPLTTP